MDDLEYLISIRRILGNENQFIFYILNKNREIEIKDYNPNWLISHWLRESLAIWSDDIVIQREIEEYYCRQVVIKVKSGDSISSINKDIIYLTKQDGSITELDNGKFYTNLLKFNELKSVTIDEFNEHLQMIKNQFIYKFRKIVDSF